MNPQYPNPLIHFGSIKIAPPILQSQKLSASQQQQLHQERKKQERLREQSRQLEYNLLHLKQSSKTFQKVINTLKSQSNFSYHQQIILEKTQTLAHMLQRFTEMSQKLVSLKQQRLENFSQILAMKANELTYVMLLKTQEQKSASADALIELHQKKVQDLSREVRSIETKLSSIEKLPDLSALNSSFIEDLRNICPQHFSESDLNILENLNFSEFIINLLTEIKSHRTTIQQLSNILLNLRQQASALMQKTYNRDELNAQLQQSKQAYERNLSQIDEITKHNDYLQEFYEHEAEKEARESRNQVSELHFKQTKKYLLTSEYLLNGFATLLPEDQFLELLSKLNELKQHAQQTKDRIFSQ